LLELFTLFLPCKPYRMKPNAIQKRVDAALFRRNFSFLLVCVIYAGSHTDKLERPTSWTHLAFCLLSTEDRSTSDHEVETSPVGDADTYGGTSAPRRPEGSAGSPPSGPFFFWVGFWGYRSGLQPWIPRRQLPSALHWADI